MKQTPLENARQRETEFCPLCVYVNGAFYCEKSGKLIHPMSLDDQGRCLNNCTDKRNCTVATDPGFKLPCKIGDRVWAIRNWKGVPNASEGIVSEMFYTKDMELMIVVKHISRGKWGETVFATQEDAEAHIVRN